MLEERGFSRAGRCDNESALAFADRRHQVHDAGRVAFGNGFEPDALVGVDCGELLENREILEAVRVLAFELGETEELGPSAAAPGFPADPHAVAEAVFADDFRGDENIVVRLGEIAAGFAEKAEAFA